MPHFIACYSVVRPLVVKWVPEEEAVKQHMTKKDKGAFLFNIKTPLGFSVHCTKDYWDFIVSEKHPSLRGHEEDIKTTLSSPDEVRKSRKDSQVFLFYRGSKPRWFCAVTKQENTGGFLVTAYPTDAIKAGETIWKKSK